MASFTNILISAIAALHLWFLTLEMFLWRKPIGLKTFHMTQQLADSSAVLAANQGLYNGFLAAGLVWGLLTSEPGAALSIKLFFLSCILIAGLFGAATVTSKILFVQAAPAAIALILLLAF